MESSLNGRNLVLGKGKIFFDRFADNIEITSSTKGEGERYLGNTPEITFSTSTEKLDHFSAEGGIRQKDDSVQLSLDRTGRITCDNINGENLALLFLGDVSLLTQASATDQTYLTGAVKKGRWYQIGASSANVTGVRNVSNVVVKKGSGFTTTVTQSGNYTVDATLGRIFIEGDAVGISDADELQITYDVAAVTREQVISSSNSIRGSLHYIADNPKGVNRDLYIPYLELAPDGDFALKGEDWQTMSFTMEILKKADGIESMYLDGRPYVPA